MQTPPVVAFFDELRLNGFTEGQNLTIVAGRFGSETSPLVERAATLTKALPDVVVTGGNPATRSAQDAGAAIPIPGSWYADEVASIWKKWLSRRDRPGRATAES